MSKRKYTQEELEAVVVSDISDDSDKDTNITENEVDSDSSEDEILLEEIFESDDSAEDVAITADIDFWEPWEDNQQRFESFPFTKDVGYCPPTLNKPTSELDFFQLFFTDELLQAIVDETNRNAQEKVVMNTPLTRRSIWASWKPVALEEFKAFLGVVINMGLNPKCELGDYFSSSWIDHQPFFKDVFAKQRFFQIFWNLNISSPQNNTLGERSRSSKVKNVLCYLESAYTKYYSPGKHVAVNESTIGSKGRVSFRCYNEDKPTKWGIKLYMLVDSTNGYVFNLEPDFGNQTAELLIRPYLPATARVVVHLAQKLVDATSACGYHIFTDSHYTSPLLAQELQKMKIHLTGSVMGNRRGLPDTMKTVSTSKMQKSEVCCLHNRYLSALAWKDKTVNLMLSSLYDNSVQDMTRRYKRADGRWIEETIQKPTVICEYNKFMRGVDIVDYSTSDAFSGKSSRWWRKVFFCLLDVTMNNAFILYRSEKNGTNYRSRNFRKKLVLQLIGDFRSKAKRRIININNNVRLDGNFHAIFLRKSNSDCKVCSDRTKPGGRKTTVYFCKTCPECPALHPGNCFEKYHTLQDYN
uniref:PiggyBac transposable element-derived protein 4-like n=1 Tax=Diabrotica virgifera virgifera TaxID=50390 RepID=A0A6P7FHC1_DIAVI